MNSRAEALGRYVARPGAPSGGLGSRSRRPIDDVVAWAVGMTSQTRGQI